MSHSYHHPRTQHHSPDRAQHRKRQSHHKTYRHEVELAPELRFPSDIPNPMVPHRAHRRSGLAPLSHYERVTLVQATLNADDVESDDLD